MFLTCKELEEEIRKCQPGKGFHFLLVEWTREMTTPGRMRLNDELMGYLRVYLERYYEPVEPLTRFKQVTEAGFAIYTHSEQQIAFISKQIEQAWKRDGHPEYLRLIPTFVKNLK